MDLAVELQVVDYTLWAGNLVSGGPVLLRESSEPVQEVHAVTPVFPEQGAVIA